MSHPSPASPTSRFRKHRWIYLSLGSVTILAVLVWVGLSVAESKAQTALTEVGQRFGLVVKSKAAKVSLWGGAGFEHVTVAHPGEAPFAQLDLIESDLTLWQAILGQRRPTAIKLSQGRATFASVQQLKSTLENLRGKDTTSEVSSRASSTSAISLSLHDISISLGAGSTQGVQLPPLEIAVHEGSVVRDSERHLEAHAAVSLNSSEAFKVSLVNKRLQLQSDTPLALRFIHEARTYAVQLGQLDLDLATSQGSLSDFKAKVEDSTTHEQWALALERLKVVTKGNAWREDLELTLQGAQVDSTHHGKLFLREGTAKLSGQGHIALTLQSPGFDLYREGHQLEGSLHRIDVAGAFPETPRSPLELLQGFTRAELSGGEIALTLPPITSPEEREPLPEGSDKPKDAPTPSGQDVLMGLDDELANARPQEDMSEQARQRELLIGLLLGSAPGPENLLGFLPSSYAGLVTQYWPLALALKPSLQDLSLTVKRGTDALIDVEGVSLKLSDEGEVEIAAEVYAAGKSAATLSAKLHLDEAFNVERFQTEISGQSLAMQLARLVPHLSVQEDAEVDLELSYTRPTQPDAPHLFSGHVDLRHFSFQFWRISDREIRNLEAKVRFEGSVDRKANRLVLDMPRIEVGEAHFHSSLDLTKRAQERVRFSARVEMPRQDCGAAARSIPKALIPNLSTLALRGQMSFTAALSLDLERPRELTLDVDGELEKCQVVSLGPKIRPQDLKGKTYVHHPHEPKRGTLEHIRVGPGTREWVPQNRIPEHALLAAWVTEDRRYTEHKGVRWDLVRSALRIDLAHGRFIYGGSTITQQLVKNLYLTRDKHLARKLEEAIISWQMERVLTKEEILLLYVNCIEYGPDIYGIKAAAKTYFAKAPADLNPLESAFLMGLKPYPRAGFTQFRRQTLDIWWVRRVSHVLRMMAKYGPEIITLEEAEAFDPYQPAFARFQRESEQQNEPTSP